MSSVPSGAQARVAVLSWCDFAPQDIWHCLGTLLVVTAGEEDATGIYCARGCCSTSYRAQHSPPNKELSGPNVWSSDTEKPTLWDSPGAHKALYFCLLHIVTYSWHLVLVIFGSSPTKYLVWNKNSLNKRRGKRIREEEREKGRMRKNIIKRYQAFLVARKSNSVNQDLCS